MAFLDEKYLLCCGEAETVYKAIATLPIVDLHSHVKAERIALNRGWEDLWGAEAEEDHYIWALMRRGGVAEEKITGHATNEQKWQALAQVFPRFAGNPVYEWLHLDLRNRFGIRELINPGNAAAIWQQAKVRLAEDRMKPLPLLKEMNVETLCTTDSPLSDLVWHQDLRKRIHDLHVLPTWRPDAASRIGGGEWSSFVNHLAERMDVQITSLSSFMDGLAKTHQFFAAQGCVGSDHAIEQPQELMISQKRASRIFDRARQGKLTNAGDQGQFQMFMLHFFADLDVEAGWLMQLHVGAIRDYRDLLFISLGREAGGDVASHNTDFVRPLRGFLNKYDRRLRLVLYCLHPSHVYTLATLARAFPGVSVGASWWFMDNPIHMQQHLTQLASVDLLANFAGMVTDSRKLLAYQSRTEMFRRTLASRVGEMVARGRMTISVGIDIAKAVAYARPHCFLRGGS